jgi:hypothetical protein
MDNYLANNSGVDLSFELAIDGYCCIENWNRLIVAGTIWTNRRISRPAKKEVEFRFQYLIPKWPKRLPRRRGLFCGMIKLHDPDDKRCRGNRVPRFPITDI